MTPELCRALINAHPAVFIRPDGDTAPPEACLVECGDGWHDLLKKMAREIESWAATSGYAVYIWQAKEKFGTLRIHWRPADEGRTAPEQMKALQTTLRSAERCSEHVCEACGRPGRLTVEDGIARTRCAEHHGLRLRTLLSRTSAKSPRMSSEGQEAARLRDQAFQNRE